MNRQRTSSPSYYCDHIKKQVGYNYNTDTIDHVSYCIRKKTPGEAAFNVVMWNEGRYLLTSGPGSPALIDTQSCERF
jgi:hypothetical protein